MSPANGTAHALDKRVGTRFVECFFAARTIDKKVNRGVIIDESIVQHTCHMKVFVGMWKMRGVCLIETPSNLFPLHMLNKTL